MPRRGAFCAWADAGHGKKPRPAPIGSVTQSNLMFVLSLVINIATPLSAATAITQ